MEWNPAGGRHHPCLTTHSRRPAQTPSRQVGRNRFTGARRSKERTYTELLNNQRCRLVVLATGDGGEWSEEAAAFISNLDIPVGAGLHNNANNNANLIVPCDQPMHSYHQYLHHSSLQRIPCTYPMPPMYLGGSKGGFDLRFSSSQMSRSKVTRTFFSSPNASIN